MSFRLGPLWKVLLATSLVLTPLACSSSCRRNEGPSEAAPVPRASLRLFLLGGAASAIEPCGCVKDMLGGVDHLAALVKSKQAGAGAHLVLSSGPFFFSDPTVPEAGRDQAVMKAEALADAMKGIGLTAMAPGANDFALGAAQLDPLIERSGAALLASNLSGPSQKVQKSLLIDRGIKVGIVGVSSPRTKQGLPEQVDAADPAGEVRKAQGELVARGAQVLILMIAAHRGEALRLVEQFPEFQVAVLGKGFDEGEGNDKPFPPELIGSTLVVQGPNHLQGVVVVDLFVRDGSFRFADGSGLAALEQRESLERRRKELSSRLEGGAAAKLSPEDRKKLEAAQSEILAQLRALDAQPRKPEGSYFSYEYLEVRESLGADPEVVQALSAYYQRVNAHNQKVFADRKPPEAAKGEATYLGVERCASCHTEEHKFWQTTQHAHAYETLTEGHKEFNLDCVSCHVTGYEKPGGTSVTHVAGLTDVQCEVCHGPGSLHAASPLDKKGIRRMPELTLCATCHHAPHVGPDWSVGDAWPKILGPGHGR